ncbi:hypothetical protein EBME_1081 [bacterium endosymbiont of Mortierella elongata FMR23-6]|nr:hypothetical protein EBME_1081 [bacterium endosymbiont of Mortierella elongata FMR23-6]
MPKMLVLGQFAKAALITACCAFIILDYASVDCQQPAQRV